jgi:hypothetical protein
LPEEWGGAAEVGRCGPVTFLLTARAGIAFRMVREVASSSECGRCVGRFWDESSSHEGGIAQARHVKLGSGNCR